MQSQKQKPHTMMWGLACFKPWFLCTNFQNFRPSSYLPPMYQIVVLEQSLQDLFQQVLSIQSELQRVEILDDQFYELEDFLDDQNMGHVAYHIHDIRYHLHIVKYNLRVSLTI